MSELISAKVKKPWYKRKFTWLFLIILFVISGIGFFIYINFNKLLSQALHSSFEKSIVSDVYELKFENLWVNFMAGDIRVSNVVIQPRKKPLKDYPYINSSFVLTTKKLLLKNVKIKELLQNNTLDLDKVLIDNPEIAFMLSGEIHVLFPFKDSTEVSPENKNTNKKTVDSFFLQSFELKNAVFKVSNYFEQREFDIQNIDISLNELYMSQQVGVDSFTCKTVNLSVGSVAGTLLKSPLRNIKLKDFKFEITDLVVQKFITAANFRFNDFSTELKDLDLLTADSVFHIAVKKFDLSYKDKSLNLKSVEFTPYQSEAEIQKNFKYQKTQFSGNVKDIDIKGINYDSLIFNKKLFIDELIIDGLTANIFKDKTKPMDLNRFPEYPGQQIGAIPLPLHIKKVTAKNSAIVNREKKPDGQIAKVTVDELNAIVLNVTNLDKEKPLSLDGRALLNNKVLFNVAVDFRYDKPEFSIVAKIPQFNIRNLNTLMHAYTPAKTNDGTVDEITMNGVVYRTGASGTFKFLYHDLNIDLQLKEKAEWKNSLGEFAANTVLSSSNPADGKPPRIVTYTVERDMNKGFINIIIKSLLEGVKQTILPSKENRKAYSKTKKEWQSREKP